MKLTSKTGINLVNLVKSALILTLLAQINKNKTPYMDADGSEHPIGQQCALYASQR